MMQRRQREDAPERRCIVTRTAQPADAMIRFVLAPDGTVVPDLRRRLPGRGAWVTATAASVTAAARRNVFARAFRAHARPPADLAEQVEAQLLGRALEALSLANKAGQVVAGYTKVEEAIRSGEAVALIHAAEAGSDGVRRLEALAKGLDRRVAGLRSFASEQMGLALGRSNVIHAALKAGDLARQVVERAVARERYRGEGCKAQRPDAPSADSARP
jgi:predicted RNA-binding protein YlxR (DUF448 family)